MERKRLGELVSSEDVMRERLLQLVSLEDVGGRGSGSYCPKRI